MTGQLVTVAPFYIPDEGPMHENDGSVVYVFWGFVGLVLGLVCLFLNTHREQLSTSPHLSCVAKALSNIMTDLLCICYSFFHSESRAGYSVSVSTKAISKSS